MSACEFNIARKRGDTRRVTFVIKYRGEAVPIDEWTNFELGIDSRSAPDNFSTNVATLQGEFTTDGSDGSIYFPVPATLPVGDFFYDAQATDSNGEIWTFAEGIWRVKEDRTK